MNDNTTNNTNHTKESANVSRNRFINNVNNNGQTTIHSNSSSNNGAGDVVDITIDTEIEDLGGEADYVITSPEKKSDASIDHPFDETSDNQETSANGSTEVDDSTPAEDKDNPNGEGEKTEEDKENPDGDVEKPEGDRENPDGDVEKPEGDEENPDGNDDKPEGDKENPNGDGEKPEGDKENPNGDGEKPEGDKENPDGDGEKPEGDKENPDGNDNEDGAERDSNNKEKTPDDKNDAKSPESNADNNQSTANQNNPPKQPNNKTGEGDSQTKKDADDFRNRSKKNQANQGKEGQSSEGENNGGGGEDNKDDNKDSDGEESDKENGLKSKAEKAKKIANAAKDPKQAIANKIREKINAQKKKILKALIKTPIFWIIVGIFVFLLLLVGMGDGISSSTCKYVSSKYDIYMKKIKYTDADNKVSTIDFEDFVKSLVYQNLYDKFIEGKDELFDALRVSFIVNTTNILSILGDLGSSQVISISSSNYTYFDIKIGNNTYSAITPAMEKELEEAFNGSKGMIFSSQITKIKKVKEFSDFDKVIHINDGESENYKSIEEIAESVGYNSLLDYETKVPVFTGSCTVSMNWPVGSSEPDVEGGNTYLGIPDSHSLYITSDYLVVRDEINSNPHSGIDIRKNSKGDTIIIAADSGEVTAVRYNCDNPGGTGDGFCINRIDDIYHCANYIEIKHDSGETTKYVHLVTNSIPEELRHPGVRVEAGQKLGLMGTTGCSTGVHLHFEVKDKNGHNVDPKIYVSKDAPRV